MKKLLFLLIVCVPLSAFAQFFSVEDKDFNNFILNRNEEDQRVWLGFADASVRIDKTVTKDNMMIFAEISNEYTPLGSMLVGIIFVGDQHIVVTSRKNPLNAESFLQIPVVGDPKLFYAKNILATLNNAYSQKTEEKHSRREVYKILRMDLGFTREELETSVIPWLASLAKDEARRGLEFLRPLTLNDRRHSV